MCNISKDRGLHRVSPERNGAEISRLHSNRMHRRRFLLSVCKVGLVVAQLPYLIGVTLSREPTGNRYASDRTATISEQLLS